MKKLAILSLVICGYLNVYSQDSITREWYKQYRWYSHRAAMVKNQKEAMRMLEKAQYYLDKIYERRKMFRHAKKCRF